MSWIESGTGGDVIGEAPADAVRRALDQIAQENILRLGRRPTLPELLAATAVALKRTPAQLRANFTGAPHRSAEGIEAESRAVTLLSEAFDAASAEYAETWDRAPRERELLETVAYVLRADLARYVSDRDAERLELSELAFGSS
jgi:hypothetical protein